MNNKLKEMVERNEVLIELRSLEYVQLESQKERIEDCSRVNT